LSSIKKKNVAEKKKREARVITGLLNKRIASV